MPKATPVNVPVSHLPPGSPEENDLLPDLNTDTDLDIDFIDLLPNAVAKKLQGAALLSLQDLKGVTQLDLAQIPKMGKTSILKIVSLAAEHGVTIEKGKAPKKATPVKIAAKKSNGSSQGLQIKVVAYLVGAGTDMVLCEGYQKVKNGATLQDSVCDALENTAKVANKLP